MLEDDPTPTPDDEPSDTPDPEPAREPESDAKSDAPDADKSHDYRRELRQYERNAKRASEKDKKRIADLEAALKKREDADKSEHERAVEAARAEGEQAALSKYEEQRRADRIENAVTKLSLKGFKAKDKDGNETTLRFADPDDAQLRLERALRNEDLTYDDIYSDGKVNTEAVMGFLTELLTEHPRLRAEGNGGGKKDPPPDFDGGKGKGGGGQKDLDEMSPDEHYKAIHGKT